MELDTVRRRITKAFSQSSSQSVQLDLEPMSLTFKHRNASENEMLVVAIANGAGIVQVEQVHNRKTAGQEPCLVRLMYKSAFPTVHTW